MESSKTINTVKYSLSLLWILYVVKVKSRRLPYFLHLEEYKYEKYRRLLVPSILGSVGICATVNLFSIINNN